MDLSDQSSKLNVIFPGGVSGDPGEGSGLAGFCSASGSIPGLRRGWWRSPGNRTEEGKPVSLLPKGGTGPLRPGADVRGPNMDWGT